MLKHVLYASAALALLAAPSYAVSESVTINGSVAPKCSIANGLSSSIIELNELAAVDGTAAVVVKNVNVTGGAWCNAYNNTIVVSAPPLANTTHTGTLPTGFTGVVNYTLSAASYGSFDSSSTPMSDTMATPFDYSVTGAAGTITTKTTTEKLVAGDYQAIVEVTLTPGS